MKPTKYKCFDGEAHQWDFEYWCEKCGSMLMIHIDDICIPSCHQGILPKEAAEIIFEVKETGERQ